MIVEMIRKRYGDMCRLCPPLPEERYDEARAVLPVELFDVLKTADGIEELMTHPNVDGGEPFAVGYLIYSFDEILSSTKYLKELFDADGIVFSGNGAGGYYVILHDGSVWLYEYPGEDGERCADSLAEFFK